MHSLQTWGYSESRDKDNRGGEDVYKAIKYMFADENKRRFLVAYEHVTKREANVNKSSAERGNIRPLGFLV